jgi:hypothetical protein
MSYSLPLDSQNELFLSVEEQRYGTCIDEKSLQLVSMLDFLSSSNNHIIVIINGFKYGSRRASFESTLHGNLSLYKNNDEKFYIKSKYNKMIEIKEYFDFFNFDKKIFKLISDETLNKFLDLRTYEIHSFEDFKLTAYTIEEYNNLMI